MSALAPVRDADQLDWATIDAYVRTHAASIADGPLRDVQQFTNGAANLTYLLRFGERELVLRRPPSGVIAPGAHDMRREWRVLSRLWRHFDRAPRAYLFCDDPAVAGADFFVMQHRPGVVIRDEIPAPMAGARGRRATGELRARRRHRGSAPPRSGGRRGGRTSASPPASQRAR